MGGQQVAIGAGALADAFGMGIAIQVVAGLTAASGLLVAIRMPGTRRSATGSDGR